MDKTLLLVFQALHKLDLLFKALLQNHAVVAVHNNLQIVCKHLQQLVAGLHAKHQVVALANYYKQVGYDKDRGRS